MIDIKLLAGRLRRPRPGRVILFCGAGFSHGATNSLGDPIPLAKDFAKQLTDAIGETADLPLTMAAEVYNERSNDEAAFLTLIKSTFSAKQVPEAQKIILSYPWKRIYTTNYDDVAEFVSAPDGTRPNSFTRDAVPLVFEDKARQIIHLNGYVGALTGESVIDDLALTMSSYFDKSLFGSKWATTLRQDFELADLIVFCGYSLYDSDISNLLGQNPALRDKTIVIQRTSLSDSEEKFLGRFGVVLKIGNDGFADLIKQAIADGMPLVSVDGPENFSEIRMPDNPPSIGVSDKDIDALFNRGIYNREIFFSSQLNGGRHYLIDRGDAEMIANSVAKVGSQAAVHCELGNGKTFVIEHVAFHLLTAKRRVFLFNRKTDNFAYDIEFFSKLTDPYVLIFEGLISNEDAIEAITSQLTQSRVILTGRSAAFDVKTSDIRHLFSDNIQVFDVNKLRDNDIEDLIKVLDAGAYWSQFPKARTKRDKKAIVERDCKREMASVILGVVGSRFLDEKIRGLFSAPQLRARGAQRAIALALCLNFVEMKPTFEFLSELLSMDVFSVMSRFKDEHAKQFFAISGIEIIARSPLMSGYLLRNLVSDDVLIDVLLEALQSSSDRHQRARRYRELNSKFMQFSFIEKIISSTNNKYLRIQDYYDRAGDIGYKEFSPHYWLQYAIAARSFKDFRSADRYFAQSKKVAERKSDFYTYKIDNAYAQFLIESRRETDDWGDYFDAFIKASTLVSQQTYLKRTGMYPYKVVSMFGDYLDVRAGQFSTKQKREAMETCLRWVQRIDELQHAPRKNKLVKQARASVLEGYEQMTELLKK